MAMLEISNLEVYYGVIQAIKGISFEVNEGEIVALIGANGAGKTTILHTITGLIPSSAGKIHFEGKDITRTPGYKIVSMGMAHVPEGRRVFSQLSVYENLKLGAYTRKDKNEFEETLKMIYGRFPRLEERRNQLAGTLSGGERSRLLFVGLTLARYSLLMLDEPTNHLDMEGKEALAQTLQQFEGGVLLVSHDRQLISQSCNRFWLIEEGKLSEWHDAEAVFERLRESAGLATSTAPAIDAATVQPSPYDDLLERLVALEALLEDDLARKPKHQKPQLQAQWRKEIEEIEAQL